MTLGESKMRPVCQSFPLSFATTKFITAWLFTRSG